MTEEDNITFWADDLAEAIIHRESYNYLDKKVPSLKEFTIKSSTSISGVPHIGNASDIFRAEAVVKALRDAGQKVKFIWVAENMDPLRKVPAGIPERFEAYLGRPVAELPCPEDCCGSYSEHFVNLFIDSLREHFGVSLEVLYMHQVYSSGKLYPLIKTALDRIDQLRTLINKYRDTPLPAEWIPWKPICEKCGKIITTRMIGRDGNDVMYSCEDYSFKHRTIQGCGHQGVSDIKKSYGKLLWRVEWASQWALWKIPFEPFGKEHGVNCPHITGTPRIGAGSFWVAGNIAEEIFDWPEPCPTKGPNGLQPYEYVLVGNQKMSASLGNTIATWDWPTFAPPETLKLFFLRKPKSQSNIMASKKMGKGYQLIDEDLDIPRLIDDLIDYSKLFYNFNAEKIMNKLKIEESKITMYKRLYELCQVIIPLPAEIPKILPTKFIFLIIQFEKIIGKKELLEKSINMLKKFFNVNQIPANEQKKIETLLNQTKKYLQLYAPDQIKFEIKESIDPTIKAQLTPTQIKALTYFREKILHEEWDEESLKEEIYSIGNKFLQKGKFMFQLLYKILFGKDSGPQLAPLILIMDKDWIIKRIDEILI
ncbi:MAG TPA: lysine--tRNA ligase [Candidatus Deferrimicrobium sp.]|nr:lysine--tRNA ligase [Candidatus Deferrimicrobium sp.]